VVFARKSDSDSVLTHKSIKGRDHVHRLDPNALIKRPNADFAKNLSYFHPLGYILVANSNDHEV
jgi:hypothetical protein